MDRLEFMHRLENENQDFASMVINSFDQFMALYSIVGHYKDLQIQNENNLSFTVSLENSDKISQLQNLIALNNYMIQVYSHIFQISINSISGNSMNITLR